MIALVVLSPLLLGLALLIRIKLGGPVFFKQERVGQNAKTFTLYKFRTMTEKRDNDGNLLPDNIRLTRFGSLMRSASLDELPELFNILKGEMSLIGPRPLPVVYLPYYTKEEMKRHLIRPGLSGWAQVNGRHYLRWEDRFKYDIEYVNNVSLLFDIKILVLTVKKVILRSDVGVRGVDFEDISLHELRKTNN